LLRVRLSRFQVECKLAEFEGICQISKALNNSHEEVSFSPGNPSVQSSRLCKNYNIHLPSYAILCGVLGVSRREDIEATVKMKRYERRTKRLVVVRILGALKGQSSPSSDESMALAVSQSFLACSESQRKLKILYRRMCIWDPVKGSFAESVVVKEMPVAELSMPNAEDYDSSTSDKNVRDFKGTELIIPWERMFPANRHAGGVFEP
jgi:hypothetical protein